MKFSLNCRIVLLYMLGGSSAYSYAVCPSSRKCSSKWRLRLLDFQSNYSQQRGTVHFLRHWLYSLSPRCMSAMRFKADTEAAEAQRPYGADGQSYSPLNPADLCLSRSHSVSPYWPIYFTQTHSGITVYRRQQLTASSPHTLRMMFSFSSEALEITLGEL